VGGSSKKVVVGYKHHVGMHLVFCDRVDKITAIEVDKKTVWEGQLSSNNTVTLDKPDLFGGESSEGGITGDVDIEFGDVTQTVNPYLASAVGGLLPAFKGVFALVLKQVYVGLHSYMKPWSIWATRTLTKSDGSEQWYVEAADINGSANPAHIIRECLTDTTWGLSYPESEIDDNSFIEAANTLRDENFGLSFLKDGSTSIDEFIDVVKEHIDASLFVDKSTGLFTLKLIRDNSHLDHVVIDETHIKSIKNFKASSFDKQINSFTVNFWDEATGEENSRTEDDPALISQQNRVVNTSKSYAGITNADLASRVALRDLKALSTPLMSCEVYTTRIGAQFSIGDTFMLTHPDFGIENMIVRVVNMHFGTTVDNTVKLTVLQDVFSIAVTGPYQAPQATLWGSPVNAPEPVNDPLVIEAPYWEIVQQVGDNDAQQLDDMSSYIVTTAVRPTGDAINADLFSFQAGSYQEIGTVDFMPVAEVTNTVDRSATQIDINSGLDLDLVEIGTWALIDQEIVRVDAITNSSITVARGCLDTVPLILTSGSKVYFADDYLETDGYEYVLSESPNIKLLTKTSAGRLDIEDAASLSTTIEARQAKPYPPGDLKINGERYPSGVSGDLVISWSHRDRLQQTASIVDTLSGSIGPESGVTYSIRIYDETNTLLQSVDAITGTSHTLTLAQELVLAGGYNNTQFRIELWSVRDGIESHTKYDYSFSRSLNSSSFSGSGSTNAAVQVITNVIPTNSGATISSAQLTVGIGSMQGAGSGSSAGTLASAQHMVGTGLNLSDNVGTGNMAASAQVTSGS